MDAQETQETFNEIKTQIEEKYQKMIDKISSVQKEIDDAIYKYANKSQEWIDKKIKMLTNKLNEYKKIAEDWLKTQMNKLREWVKSIEDAIKEWIEKQIANLAMKLLEMIGL